MFQRILPYLLFAAHVALWVVAATTLGRIEGPYPDHFDLSGQPDSWTEGPWWLVPLIALGMTVLLVGAVALSRRLARASPGWVNVPRKAEWLTLPPEARIRTLRPVEAMVLGAALFMNLLMVSLVLDTHAVAIGRAQELSITKLIVVLVCLAAWVVLSIIRIRRAIGDELRAARRQ